VGAGAEAGRGGEVGELGLGGAADADLEEALVEVELDEVVRALDVLARDGGAGGDVPDVLAYSCRK
jgi:hypothetical protein